MKKSGSYLIFQLLILAASQAAAAGPVSFTAWADRQLIERSEQVELTLQLSGAKPAGEPLLTPMDDFQVISSGASSRIEVINGVAKSSIEYRYILLPLKSGTLTIPPATVEAAGTTYRTRPIEIEVRGGGEAGRARSTKPLFVELTADRETAYLDEQVLLTFRFYQSGAQARDFQYSPPPVKGFRMETLGNADGEVGTAVVDGKLYNTITLRYALFPYQTGKLSVGPAVLRCTLPGEQRRPRPRSAFDDFFSDSFFFQETRTPVNLATEALAIEVLPLPSEGRPEGEKISVGRYSMEVSVNPKRVKVGDPLTVKTVIEGEGNLDTVSAPVVCADSAFKTYEPSSKTEITARSTAIAGRKTFEEILVPLKENVKEIPAIRFTYFDTATRKYRTISKGPIPVEVLPAPEEGPVQIVELRPEAKGSSIEILKKDIHFIKLSPGRFTPAGRTILSDPLFIVANILPAVLFGGLLVITRKRERLRSDFAYARRSRAYRRAISGSKRCEALIGKSAAKEFYSSAEGVLTQYIGDRMNVPPASVSRETAAGYARSLGMDEEAVSRVGGFYRDCELAQYASKECEASEMRGSLESLNEIIRSIEKKKG